jgi:hypothetical protein
MKKLILTLLLGLIISFSFAQTKHPSYSGTKHTTSHGGHYTGGKGSSHKGGHYVNRKTSNTYGTHKRK